MAATAGFSGAEIEQLIIAAMYEAFGSGSELRDEHLLAQARATKPLAVLMRERIIELRGRMGDACPRTEIIVFARSAWRLRCALDWISNYLDELVRVERLTDYVAEHVPTSGPARAA